MRIRLATVLAVAFLLPTGVAQANVTSSNITSPANGTYIESLDNPPTPTTLTVTGTSNGTTGDHVDIDCFWGTGGGNFAQLVTNVPVGSDGSFSATGTLTSPIFFTPSLAGEACRLRAEPAGTTNEAAAFTGPKIAVSEFNSLLPDRLIFSFYENRDTIVGGPNNGAPYDYYANGTTFSSYAGWYSAGSCGPFANTLDPTFSGASEALSCVGSLFNSDSFSRSEIVVDTKNAYDPSGAYLLVRRSNTQVCPPNCDGTQDDPGFPPLTVSQSWNPANGLESTVETDGIVECTGSDGFQPPNQTACPSFQPSGVELQRSVSMTTPDTITLTDSWSSTDGKPHTVDAEYDDEVTGNAAGVRFPGETGFSVHGTGDVVAGPSSAPGSIFTRTDVTAADGSPDDNYGAITFASAPSEFLFSTPGEFAGTQTLLVPATGSAKLTYIYSFGTTLAGVQALALAAQDQLRSPSVSIGAPANGSRRHKRMVTVTGTATAGSGIRSVTVNGVSANLTAGGGWSAQVTLRRGTNALTATATSNSGLTASAQITVVYAKRCVVPHVNGLSRAKAEKTIAAAGCTVGKIIKRHSSLHKGDAVGIKPKPGSTRKPGAKVKLIVSEGT